MTAWNIFWKAVKAFLGWLLLTLIFMFTASFTTGFKAYLPLTSLIYGCIAVFITILILGVAMGALKE